MYFSCKIYEMKLQTATRISLLLATSLILANCSTTVRTNTKQQKSKPMPPGQAKKVDGAKSAKPYAPGHNKS